jgi:Spy/CpxP family protein refolding chaperone
MAKKILIAVTGIVLLASLSLSLTAEMGFGDQMKRRGFRRHMAEKNLFPVHQLLKFKDEVGLTDEQVAKIEKMQLAHSEYVVKKRADIKVSELKFASYLKKDNINRSTVAKMIQEIGRKKTGLLIDNINYLLDVKEILTAEQIQKVEDLKKEIRMRHFRRGDRRKGRR